jgi:methylated-DNA-[protein]-cysteine S-methyltransferase
MRLFVDKVPSPLGELFIALTETGAVNRLWFLHQKTVEQASAACANKDDTVEWNLASCSSVARQLKEYFDRRRRSFELQVEPQGTPFQKKVWDELLRIPYGETVTYGDLALRLGNQQFSRAVGHANAANPIAIIIPCHRVIGSDRSLTGYGGGLAVKRALLVHEGALLI